MPIKPKNEPPAHLQPTTQTWFRAVVADFELEEHHIKLLTLAAESWDRATQARQALAANGLTFLDRFDCPHARPEVAIERDSRIAFARLVRELALDVSAPAETAPRTVGISGNSHRRAV